MTAQTKLSSKGQVVIPKEIRDALRLRAGATLAVRQEGHRILLEPAKPAQAKISYEEFKRRVPPLAGCSVTVEQMNDVSAVFEAWKI